MDRNSRDGQKADGTPADDERDPRDMSDGREAGAGTAGVTAGGTVTGIGADPDTEPDVLRPGAPWGGPLAPRELVVLALLSVGYTPDELPRLLRATPETLRAHLGSATARLGAADWRAAVREARRRGLID